MARTRGGRRHIAQYRRRSQTSSSSGSQLYSVGGESPSSSVSPGPNVDAASTSAAPCSAPKAIAPKLALGGNASPSLDISASSLSAGELAKTRRRLSRGDGGASSDSSQAERRQQGTASASGYPDRRLTRQASTSAQKGYAHQAGEGTEGSESSESNSDQEWAESRRAPPASSGKTVSQKAMPSPVHGSHNGTESSEGKCDGSRSPPPRRARSVSVQGYTWETECLSLTPADIENRLTYHKAFKTTARDGDGIKFRRDDLIYVLPDPAALDKRDNDKELMGQEDLPDEEWAVAQIADCCLLKSASGTDPDVAMLRVRWMYTPAEAKGITNLHGSYKTRMNRYKFGEKELIYTDHFDFIPLDCYAGLSEDHYAHVEILGLEVPDCERVGPEEMRSNKTLKEYVWMTGFDSKKKGRPPITKDASRNARSAEGEPLFQEGATTASSSEKSGTKKRKAGPGGQSKRVTQKAKRPVTSSS